MELYYALTCFEISPFCSILHFVVWVCRCLLDYVGYWTAVPWSRCTNCFPFLSVGSWRRGIDPRSAFTDTVAPQLVFHRLLSVGRQLLSSPPAVGRLSPLNPFYESGSEPVGRERGFFPDIPSFSPGLTESRNKVQTGGYPRFLLFFLTPTSHSQPKAVIIPRTRCLVYSPNKKANAAYKNIKQKATSEVVFMLHPKVLTISGSTVALSAI